MAQTEASSVELVDSKTTVLDGDDTSDADRNLDDTTYGQGFASDGESGGEKEKWTSIFTSGAEDPQWARLKGGIIHPQNRRYTIWSGVNAILVAYWTFATWLIWGFLPRPSIGLVVSQAIISCFFAVDIGLRFRVSYLDTKTLTLVQDPSKIAKRYLTRGFIFDVLSIIPFDLLFYIFTSHPSRGWLGETLRALPLLRMFRLSDTFHFFSRIEKEGQSVYHTLKFGKLAMLVFLSAHIAACLLWFISRQEVNLSGDPAGCIFGAYSDTWQEWPLYKKWVSAFYWSVLTVSSIGYGDFLPVTQFERIVVCAYEIFGLGVLSYCLGSMEVLLVRDTDRTGQYHDKVRALNDYAKRKSLPPGLKQALKQHLALEMAVDKVRPNVLNAFPHHLKAKVLRSQHKERVARTYLFKNTSPQFLDQVVGEMDLEIQLPNTAVVMSGDVAENLYLVVSGSLTRESPQGESAQPDDAAERGNLLRAGAVFGKVAVLYDVPQMFTVRTLEVCELLKLDKAALTRILKAYPEDNRQMLANLHQRISSRGKAGGKPARDGAQELALELSTVLEQQDTEVTRRVCNTAARGNAKRLAELLVTPGLCNGADYDGRAPLHFAAAGGHAESVEVLVKAGADVNAQDHLGRTPLLEAVMGGHPACVALLRAAGARLELAEAGRTLCQVVAAGATDKVAALLECGADPNATSYDGRTALHVAAVRGLEEAARLLLHAGADADFAAKGGQTPRAEAQAAGRSAMLRLFDEVTG